MTAAVQTVTPDRSGFFAALAPGAKTVFFTMVIASVCLLFAFPVLWLILTSTKPAFDVFYVHQSLNFTADNFRQILGNRTIMEAFVNSAVLSTVATALSLAVTVSSGYMLSRFSGPIANLWFGTIYVFRCVPYISWVLPLFFLTQSWGIYDTFLGLLLPHIAIHICFFSWLMKGFFDGIDPSMEYAALIDGCTRWGAFCRVALPAAVPGLTALGVLCWLFTWNEFLFALLLTGPNTPILTVAMAQFVHEMGMDWHLMSATATLALIPALLITIFGQKYVIRGLKL